MTIFQNYLKKIIKPLFFFQIFPRLTKDSYMIKWQLFLKVSFQNINVVFLRVTVHNIVYWKKNSRLWGCLWCTYLMPSLCKKCPNTEFLLVRIRENTNQEKLRIWTLFTQCFECIPHDLNIAKLEPYGFQMDALKLAYGYLSNKKQRVRMNETFSL